MIKIVFTKTNTVFGKLTCWALKEPVSHMAIVIDDRIVFHSNFQGTHLKWFKSFLKSGEIKFQRVLHLGTNREEEIYQRLSLMSDRPYDFLALAYFIWRGMLYRFFKKPIPMRSPFGARGAYLCVELANALPDYFWEMKKPNLNITSPYQLAKILKAEEVKP